MADESQTQPLLSNEDRKAAGEHRKPPPLICAQMSGIDPNYDGAACPWTNKGTEGRSEDMNKLSRAVVFCLLFMFVEVVGGIKAGSLAILTDAAHLLSDVASFAISLFAMWAGGWEANARQSYGFFRLEILGALVSIQIIWLITGGIVYEAFGRLRGDPVLIDGRLMFIIAALGLVVNLVMMFILDHGHDHGHGHGHGHGHDHGHMHSHGSGHGGHSRRLGKQHSHGHGEGQHSHGHGEGQHSHGHGEGQHSHGHGEGQHSHNHSAVGRHHNDGDDHEDEHHHDHGTHSNIEQREHDHRKDDHGEHGMEDEQQAIGDLHIEHKEKGGELSLSSGDRLDQAALILRQDGHNTECVEKNVTRNPRSSAGDTIIMCICDEAEKPESVRVTIDHGVDHEGHGDSPSGRSINVQGAYLHVLGDFIQSIGCMIGGAVIWWKPNWRIVDLICTFIFSILVLGTTIKMLRDILDVLMESTPREIDARALQSGLMEIEGVKAVHELHIWAITVGKVVLACHVMIDPDADSDKLLAEVIKYCDKNYKISHVTVQIERLRQLQRHLDS